VAATAVLEDVQLEWIPSVADSGTITAEDLAPDWRALVADG